ncbi:MAG TPA: AGE family epimerase/isomerase [Acidimicrobiales bacterium]|jgi:mannose/cellobiose epimerase-like protein (N-acyl-D-glucosamine 2-epimerase family)/anti-anti-sigma regulatory factor|nr:AGE family epimerase/isomerase [Acidimicrobiales bacterium]
MSTANVNFTFSDTIAGYVTAYDDGTDSFGLRTSDGREFQAFLTKNTFSQAMRNFGEAYLDTTSQMRDMLVPERFLFAYGIFYPEAGGLRYEVKSMIFPSIRGKEYIFEQPRWWVNQARFIGDFYLRGQFPDGNYDWRNYRTKLSLSGTHTPDYIAPDYRQETDTISRLVYGLATAYLLTGEDRFLQAAESGTEYLREHMRATNEAEGIVYWYHGIDVSGNSQRKIFTSEFGDDYDAIPMYEQIYALAGPTQTYRVTGDPRILDDIDKTITLFDRFYRDTDKGGFFSHLDPVNLDGRSDALRSNRARKNWNSVGDHAPAYLINAVIATGRQDLADFLVETGNTILERFPDDEHSPFVQERFHEDWTADRKWGWQQDSAVVGHNLKIAWNLMRIHHLRPNDGYVHLANKIADTMPKVGSDQQRGGWYDVVERTREPGQEWHRFIWHDRKAWWQQEQGILAYYILAGSLGNHEHTRLARESAAFYNAHFLDHDEGGVYFNVLASGIPYLVGNERLKGSHSMSGYHSMELCYLAAVYSNLLVNEEDLELHFKPKAVSFPDGTLRVAPDLLPPGSVRLAEVWVNDLPYADFDPDALTVRLPQNEECRVKVRIVSATDKFDSQFSMADGTARVVLRGRLDPDEVIKVRRDLERVIAANPSRVVINAQELESISRQGMNELLFFRAKVQIGEEVYVVGCNQAVAETFIAAGDDDAGGEFHRVDDESDIPA